MNDNNHSRDHHYTKIWKLLLHLQMFGYYIFITLAFHVCYDVITVLIILYV